MERIVDVFELDAETQIGCYVIVLSARAAAEDYEREAIRCAIEAGDAEHADQDRMIAVIRSKGGSQRMAISGNPNMQVGSAT